MATILTSSISRSNEVMFIKNDIRKYYTKFQDPYDLWCLTHPRKCLGYLPKNLGSTIREIEWKDSEMKPIINFKQNIFSSPNPHLVLECRNSTSWIWLIAWWLVAMVSLNWCQKRNKHLLIFFLLPQMCVFVVTINIAIITHLLFSGTTWNNWVQMKKCPAIIYTMREVVRIRVSLTFKNNKKHRWE